MKCPFEISWEFVSPEQAKIWIENRNTRNRPKKRAAIEAFATDMATNRWCPNHQGVAFSAEDDALIDGQNRLEAIVLSGKGQWMLVFRQVPEQLAGVEATMMEGIDRGTPRSIADMLRLGAGMKQEANVIAASCLHVARLCVPHPELQAKKASVPQTLAVLKIYKAEMEWIAAERSTQHGIKQIALTGTLAFARAVLPKETAKFLAEIKDGSGEATSPAMLVRAGLLRDELVPGQAVWDRCRAAIIILTAIRAHANGKDWPRLPRASECGKALEWFREEQLERVREVRKLFPLLRATDAKPWPPPPMPREPAAPPEAEAPHHAEELSPAPGTKWQPTAAAEKLLARAGR